MLPCEVFHILKTASDGTESSSKSSRISGEASVGGVAEDIRLSIDLLTTSGLNQMFSGILLGLGP